MTSLFLVPATTPETAAPRGERTGAQSSAAVIPKADAASESSDTALTDETREAAIHRAGFLIEFFDAEVRCFDALYERDGCMSHKGAADGARLNKAKAEDLHAALVRGRRAEAAA